MHFAFGVGNMSVEEEDVLIAERVSGPRSPRKEVMVATWATRHLGTSYLSSPSIAPSAPTTNNARVLSTPNTKYAMSDNKKQERDYTPEVDALLPEAEALVKVRPSRPSPTHRLNEVYRAADSKRELTSSLCWRSNHEMCVPLHH